MITGLTSNQSYNVVVTPYTFRNQPGPALSRSITFINDPLPAGARVDCQAKNLSLSNNTAVSTWNVLIQNTASKRPIYFSSGGYMNRSYVQFTAASMQFLHSPDGSPITMNCSTGNGYTMFVLMQFRSPNADWERVLQGYTPANLNEDFMTFHKLGNTMRIQAKYQTSTYMAPTNFLYQANTYYVFSVRVTPSGQEVRVNNIVQLTAAGGFLNNHQLHLGLAANIFGGLPSVARNNQFGNIDVAALLIYDKRLTDTEMTSVYDYLINGNAQ
jgi:hypothetical protein